MAYSYNEVGAQSPGQNISVTFPFLDRTHVSVTVNGVVQATDKWSWVNDGLLVVNSGFASGVTRVLRTTPIPTTQSSQIGAAVFDYGGVNRNDLQLLYALQEDRDRMDEFDESLDEIDAAIAACEAQVALAQAAQAAASAQATIATTQAGLASTARTDAQTASTDAQDFAASAALALASVGLPSAPFTGQAGKSLFMKADLSGYEFKKGRGVDFSPEDYGAKGDTIKGTNGAITAGASRTFTSAGANFTAADIGKNITIRGAGTGGRPLFTTVASINSTTSLQVATNAITTVSGATYLLGTDDTTAVQACLDAAAAAKGRVYGGPKFYTVDYARIKNGTESVTSLKLCGTGNSTDKGILQLDGPTDFAGTTVSKCLISAEIDMSAGWSDGSATFIGSTGIYADGCQDCTFIRCSVYGMFEGHKYGIWATNSPVGNSFLDCKITGSYDSTITQNLMSIQGNPTAFGGYLPSGAVVRATIPAIKNIISGCQFFNGSYAVILGGAEYNVLEGNICRSQGHRGFYLGPVAWHNKVIGNDIHDYGSSGVICGYGSCYNTILANSFYCNFGVWGNTGEASININTGAEYTTVIGNRIDAMKNYGVYMGCSVSGCRVIGNEIRNYMYSAIHVDSDWTGVFTSPSMQRPNYATPASVLAGSTAWAWSHTQNIAIIGNAIGAPIASTPYGRTAAISLAQNGATYNLQKVTIQGNAVVDDTGLTYYINAFEVTSGKLVNNKLVNNTFDSATTTKFFFTRDLNHFNKVDGNEVIDDGEIALAPSATTPNVAVGKLFTTANGSATSITNFLGVPSALSRTFWLKMDANTTVVHNNSLIRLKGSVNAVGASANNIMAFTHYAGIWFEIFRNF